jgi:D-alanyl-lipoteichoic acid acyltransferase DltB (MBOAT superfamily)
MILGLELTLFLYLLLAANYWLVRIVDERLALSLLVVCNVALLFSFSPVLLAYFTCQIVLVWILFILLRRLPQNRVRAWPWLAFVGLIPFNLHIWLGKSIKLPDIFSTLGTLGWSGAVWTLGATFFVIKSFIILKESLSARRFDALPALAALTFVPSFSAGPIHGTAPWKTSNHMANLPAREVLEIFLKIGWGAAALYVVAPELRTLAKASADMHFGVLGDMYLSFAALYFDFSGYSLLAIASAKLFGISLPENFNRPYLATSIQEFWQRWHMSLNAFIGTYLFKPFVRATGTPRIGILLAFVCAGLWHKVSLGYLAWGIGHGIALSLCMKPPWIWIALRQRLPASVSKLLSWIMTMSWVAALSYGATRSGW